MKTMLALKKVVALLLLFTLPLPLAGQAPMSGIALASETGTQLNNAHDPASVPGYSVTELESSAENTEDRMDYLNTLYGTPEPVVETPETVTAEPSSAPIEEAEVSVASEAVSETVEIDAAPTSSDSESSEEESSSSIASDESSDTPTVAATNSVSSTSTPESSVSSASSSTTVASSTSTGTSAAASGSTATASSATASETSSSTSIGASTVSLVPASLERASEESSSSFSDDGAEDLAEGTTTTGTGAPGNPIKKTTKKTHYDPNDPLRKRIEIITLWNDTPIPPLTGSITGIETTDYYYDRATKSDDWTLRAKFPYSIVTTKTSSGLDFKEVIVTKYGRQIMGSSYSGTSIEETKEERYNSNGLLTFKESTKKITRIKDGVDGPTQLTGFTETTTYSPSFIGARYTPFNRTRTQYNEDGSKIIAESSLALGQYTGSGRTSSETRETLTTTYDLLGNVTQKRRSYHKMDYFDNPGFMVKNETKIGEITVNGVRTERKREISYANNGTDTSIIGERASITRMDDSTGAVLSPVITGHYQVVAGVFSYSQNNIPGASAYTGVELGLFIYRWIRDFDLFAMTT